MYMFQHVMLYGTEFESAECVNAKEVRCKGAGKATMTKKTPMACLDLLIRIHPYGLS